MARLRPDDTLEGISQNLSTPGRRFVTVMLLGAASFLLLGLVYWIVLLAQLPSYSDIRRAGFDRPSVIYSADGEALANYGDKRQYWVPLRAMSRHVPEALIATEDHRFYAHWGIDVRRTAGSFVHTVGGSRQGGSTITMQLARNAFPELVEDIAITRKIKEWIVALRLEAVYEKDEILEMYLNTVPFMYNAFGIEAAARTYFQKSAAELRVDEAATLIGVLKGTAYYNPVRHPDRAHERRNVVLHQMVEHGFLTVGDYGAAEHDRTRLNFSRASPIDPIAPHFIQYVRSRIDEWSEKSGHNPENGGLRIFTTIDSRLQRAALGAVNEVTGALQSVADVEWSRAPETFFSSNVGDYAGHRRNIVPFEYFWAMHPDLITTLVQESDRYQSMLERGIGEADARRTLENDALFIDSLKTNRQRLEAGFVAIDSRSGHILAWVGGRDFAANQYDHVATARRQPGSSFKPIVYAAALENGYAPEDKLRDEVMEYTDPETNKTWRPENFDAATGEMVTLRDALAQSKNTITAKLVVDIGPETVVRYARQMGIESELDAYPSIALGTSEVTLLELTNAYVTLANGGRYRQPLFATRIEDHKGRVLATFTSEERQALPGETAQTVRDMLRGVIEHGTGAAIRREFDVEGDLAGKTGTSQEGADGWFMLIRDHLVTGAWVGFDLPVIVFRSDYWGQGSHTALPLVGTFYRTFSGAIPVIHAHEETEPVSSGESPAP